MKEDKLLMIHRRKKGDEYWVLVGGGVEEGESVEEGLLREVKEETSLTLRGFEKVMEAEEIGVKHVLYLCDANEGEVKLGGPEKEANNPDNWYNLEWVDISVVANFTDIYPRLTVAWAEKWLKDKI